MKYKTINKLISEKLLGTISHDDELLLQKYMDSHKNRQKDFDNISSEDNLTHLYYKYNNINLKDAWHKFCVRHPKEYSINIKRYISYAAAIIILLGTGLLWHYDYTQVTPPSISNEVKDAIAMSQLAHKQGAVITKIADTISLKEKKTMAKLIQSIHVDKDAIENLLSLSSVATYNNKEYWCSLEDGTIVHLNSGSRLIYPEQFGKDRRDVVLEGEAYFMVAKDKSRPFTVRTSNGDVTVYGTEFNVNTCNSNVTSVVLVSGSVSVKPNQGKEQKIRPGQMAIINDGKAIISNVDTAPFKAWNSGSFYFHDETLEKIMSVLSRWYDLDVEFKDEKLKELRFIGEFDRYGDIGPIIKGINMTIGLDIEIDGKYITIKK